MQDLEQNVSQEPAAPHTSKYLPDTGQAVLTPETFNSHYGFLTGTISRGTAVVGER